MASIWNTTVKDIFIILALNCPVICKYNIQVYSSVGKKKNICSGTSSDQALLKYSSVLLNLKTVASSVYVVMSLFALLQNLHSNLVNKSRA